MDQAATLEDLVEIPVDQVLAQVVILAVQAQAAPVVVDQVQVVILVDQVLAQEELLVDQVVVDQVRQLELVEQILSRLAATAKRPQLLQAVTVERLILCQMRQKQVEVQKADPVVVQEEAARAEIKTELESVR
jgi:hypothetical protein